MSKKHGRKNLFPVHDGILGRVDGGVREPRLCEGTFEWTVVGDPGKAADPLNSGIVPGIGSVKYRYRIAKHEATNGQYAEFLNAVAATDTNGLYNANMGSTPWGGITQSGSSGSFTYAVKADIGNKPVIYVSFFDVMRFVNWLHNDQLTCSQDANTTEDGVLRSATVVRRRERLARSTSFPRKTSGTRRLIANRRT